MIINDVFKNNKIIKIKHSKAMVAVVNDNNASHTNVLYITQLNADNN